MKVLGDRERFLFSAGITVLVYLLIFIFIDVFNVLKVEELPEYYGPMIIELEDFVFENHRGNAAEELVESAMESKSEEPESFKSLVESFLKSEKKEKKSPIVKDKSLMSSEKKEKLVVDDKSEKVDDAFKIEKAKESSFSETNEKEFVKDNNKLEVSKEDENLFEESIYDELDSLIAKKSSKSSDDNISNEKKGEGSSSSAIEFEGLSSERGLIPPVKSPNLKNEDLSKLPGTIFVVVSCLLTENGFLTALNIEKDSGYPQIATSVLEAVRTWHFEKAPGSGNIKLKIRYKITVR